MPSTGSNTVSGKIAAAFKAGRPARQGAASTDGRTIYLHGNAIVRNTDKAGLEISLAGWPTPTTRRYINAALHGATVFQSKGQQWLLCVGNQNAAPMPVDGWVKVAQ